MNSLQFNEELIMVFYTISDLHKQIGLYCEKFGLNLDGKQISECISILVDYCPRLHTDIELEEMAINNLKAIESEYGFKALRLFIYDVCKQSLLQSFTGPDRLQKKYEKLIKHLKDFHYDMFSKDLTLTLDVYRYFKFIEDVYDSEYGFIKDFDNRLFALIKTIKVTNYNPDVINVLKDTLKMTLMFSNAKYYLKQDFTDVEILRMLYEHLAEENFDELEVKDYNICTEYDGFGNEYWIHQYFESWTDEDGTHHYCSWKPEHTINNYIRIGLPE